MTLPKRVFFTGVPGSRWSGLAQMIETCHGMNITDRTLEREYNHQGFTGHRGAYFGTGMEFVDDYTNTDQAWTDPDAGTMLVKSHEWAVQLQELREHCDESGDWIMLVYRPDLPSFEWWHAAGGFEIKYPNYTFYEGPGKMLYEIQRQNANILSFANHMNLKWSSFNNEWIKETFGLECKETYPQWEDILVTVYKP